MKTEIQLFLDENIPPGIGKGLHNQFGLEVTTVNDLDMRRAKDDEILKVIHEIERTERIKIILVTADKNFSRRVENSVFIKHFHSIKKPTSPQLRKIRKKQMYKMLIEELMKNDLIKLTIRGEPID